MPVEEAVPVYAPVDVPDVVETDLMVQLVAWRGKLIGKQVKMIVSEDGDDSNRVQIHDVGIVTNIIVSGEVLKAVIDLPAVSGWDGHYGYICPLTHFILLEEAEKKAEAKPVEKEELDTEYFTNGYLLYVKNRYKGYERKIRELMAKVVEHEDVIRQINNEIIPVRKLYKSSVSSLGKIDKKKVVESSKELNERYTEIVFDNMYNKIVGITKPIVMSFMDEHDELVKIEMGVYRVILECDGSIRFEQVSRVNARHDGISEIHPHIQQNGKPCWGTWLKAVQEAFVVGDFLEMMRLAHQFLSECDINGWYVSAYAFSADTKDRCSECWLLYDSCDCDLCSNCGMHQDSCRCNKCPDTGDVIDDVSDYCSSCSHQNQESGDCEY